MRCRGPAPTARSCRSTPRAAALPRRARRRRPRRGTSTSLLFLAAREVLELLDVRLLQVTRLHVGHQKLAAIVELVGLEGFLLGHGLRVAVLAVLRGHSRLLGIREHLGGRPGAGQGDEGENDGCNASSNRDTHGQPPRIGRSAIPTESAATPCACYSARPRITMNTRARASLPRDA